MRLLHYEWTCAKGVCLNGTTPTLCHFGNEHIHEQHDSEQKEEEKEGQHLSQICVAFETCWHRINGLQAELPEMQEDVPEVAV